MRFVADDGERDVRPTTRCRMHRLAAGGSWTEPAHVGSSVFVVYAGAGTVDMTGGRDGPLSAPLGAGDVVAVPSWVETTWAAEDGVDLFEMSDAPVFEALGLARTAGAAAQASTPSG
jgi:gentisate 1,2-dioxygenase